MLSFVASQIFAHRTETAPPDLRIIKDFAINQSGISIFEIEDTDALRDQILSAFKVG